MKFKILRQQHNIKAFWSENSKKTAFHWTNRIKSHLFRIKSRHELNFNIYKYRSSNGLGCPCFDITASQLTTTQLVRDENGTKPDARDRNSLTLDIQGPMLLPPTRMEVGTLKTPFYREAHACTKRLSLKSGVNSSR